MSEFLASLENTIMQLDLNADVRFAARRVLAHFDPRKAAWPPELTHDLDQLQSALQKYETWRNSVLRKGEHDA
jgi:hypothetical protein